MRWNYREKKRKWCKEEREKKTATTKKFLVGNTVWHRRGQMSKPSDNVSSSDYFLPLIIRFIFFSVTKKVEITRNHLGLRFWHVQRKKSFRSFRLADRKSTGDYILCPWKTVFKKSLQLIISSCKCEFAVELTVGNETLLTGVNSDKKGWIRNRFISGRPDFILIYYRIIFPTQRSSPFLFDEPVLPTLRMFAWIFSNCPPIRK